MESTKNGITPTWPLSQADAALLEEEQTGRLTRREQQILKLIAEDFTNKEIGLSLGLSYKTVEFHRMRIRERLRVKGIAGMIRYAIRTGLVEP